MCRTALALLLAAVALAPGARAWAQASADVPRAPAAEPQAPPPEPEVPSPEPVPPEASAPPPAPPPPPEAPPPEPVPPPIQPESLVVEAPPRALVRRPRLSAAVGVGGTFDSVGFTDGSVHAIPSFFTVLGIGEGVFGVDLGAFASEAAGRYATTQSPVDRLALDAFGVFRPGAWVRPADLSYQMRVLHALGAELGLGFERDGRSAISGTRFVIHTGVRVDLPLSPAGEPTEVRLRIATRRGIGLYTPRLRASPGATVMEVGDSAAELYAALVVVF